MKETKKVLHLGPCDVFTVDLSGAAWALFSRFKGASAQETSPQENPPEFDPICHPPRQVIRQDVHGAHYNVQVIDRELCNVAQELLSSHGSAPFAKVRRGETAKT